MKKRRLPAPWTAEKVEGGYRVKDDHGHWLAFVYAKEDHQVPKMPNYLTWDEASPGGQGDRQAPRTPSEQGLGWKFDLHRPRLTGPSSAPRRKTSRNQYIQYF